MVADAEDGDGHRDELAAGAVEVAPAVALLDDRLEVLLPDDAVLHRVLDDGADQAGGDVGGADVAVAEVRGERQPLVITEIASAVESVPDGLLSFVLAVLGLARRAARGRP